MNIFIGVSDLGRFGELLKLGLEEHGHSVDLCDNRPNRHICYHTPKYSLRTLREELRIEDLLYPKNLAGECSGADRFLTFFSRYDLAIYFFADSVIPGFLDHALLKKLGVKIVHIFCGDDIRYPRLERLRGNWQERMYLDRLDILSHQEYNCIGSLYKNWYRHYNNLSRRLYMARIAERFCDAIFAYPCFDGLLKRGYYLFPFISDPELYNKGERENRHIRISGNSDSAIRVVHYASNKLSKSSFRVARVFDSKEIHDLRRHQLIEVTIKEKVSQRSLYDDIFMHDVVIDQYASIGAMTMDAIAAGCLPITGPNYSPMIEGELAFSSLHWRNAESGLIDLLTMLSSDGSSRELFSSVASRSYEARLPGRIAAKILASVNRIEEHKPDISSKSYGLLEYLSSLPNWNGFIEEIFHI